MERVGGGKGIALRRQDKCFDLGQLDGEQDGARDGNSQRYKHGNISTGSGTEPSEQSLGEPASTGKSSTGKPSQKIGKAQGQQPIGKPSQTIGEARGHQPIGKPSQTIGEGRGEYPHLQRMQTIREPSISASSQQSSERSRRLGESASLKDQRSDFQAGLEPPKLWTGEQVCGSNKSYLKRQNKHKQVERQRNQQDQSYWAWHKGDFNIPTQRTVSHPSNQRPEEDPTGVVQLEPG
jgi:hypothetical protein